MELEMGRRIGMTSGMGNGVRDERQPVLGLGFIPGS
jgi:hypothetical protein